MEVKKISENKETTSEKPQQQTKELKESFIKKSFQYPEVQPMQSRPVGAEVEQPPVKQDKQAKKE